MREYVYLFELDSVRKTDEEIVEGQKALYNEIVQNGNIVVLTYNQLVDSRGFFSLLENEEYQKNLIRLFENGAICISQFGDIRSLAQYLIQSLDIDKQFIYSALPVKYSQKRLLALIKRSLVYSDLSEIYEFFQGYTRSDEDLMELFKEVDEEKQVHDSSLFKGKTDADSKRAALEEMRSILKSIYWLLSTVLKLSTLHDIYIPPKEVAEYKELQMNHILQKVMSLTYDNDPLWNKALQVIQRLNCYEQKNNNRSVYHREIKKQYEKAPSEKQIFQYAEAIVDLCYNYACEISICNISKHYNVKELHPNYIGELTTFRSDFQNRLAQTWKNGTQSDDRYLLEEEIHFRKYNFNEQIPNLAQAVRYTEYVSYKENTADTQNVYRYEYKRAEHNKRHRNQILKTIVGKMLLAILCLVFAYVFEICFNFIQDKVNSYVTILPVLETILFLLFTEAVTTWISYTYPKFMSLSEALGMIGKLMCDAFGVIRKSKTYINTCKEDLEETETKSKEVSIEFILSPELKKYISYKNANGSSELFAPSTVYPIADLNSQKVKKFLVEMEELYNYRFGMVYRSPYNTLLVDPIENGDTFFPYDRVVPSSGKAGVVIIPIYQDKLILLRQYRHAPREKQYAFPRGFAEPELTPIENVRKELQEEIGAVILETPELLGRVNADSGLTSSHVYVYCVKIQSYQFDSSIHEGICNIIEVPLSEMGQWIGNGMTNDGFTLSAYALFKEHKC